MIGYRYDQNGVFAGTVALRLDPLESQKQKRDIYLMPAQCTIVPPPSIGIGEAAVWTGGSWSTLVDKRGVYYSKQTGRKVMVDAVGFEPDPGWTDRPPPAFGLWDDESGTWVVSLSVWLAEIIRPERDWRLRAALDVLDRHRNQQDFGLDTTIADADAAQWARYAQDLRDLPATLSEIVDEISWPDAPTAQ
ncbi:MAG: phage tail assembly chaperone [Pseudomonadota bacterium]